LIIIISNTQTEMKKTFRDDYSKFWLKNAECRYGFSQYHKDIIDLLTEILAKSENCDIQKILEVAIGTGYPIAVELDKMEFNISGIDLSLDLLHKMKLNSRKITGIVSDSEMLPFKDHCFFLTYCIQSSWYFPNIEKAISEMLRVTKDDGYIVIDVMNKFSPYIQYRSKGYRIFKYFQRLYTKIFNKNEPTKYFHNYTVNVFKIYRIFRQSSKNISLTTSSKIKNLGFSKFDWFNYRVIYIAKK